MVILILILEWITPWAAGRKTDPGELAFACVFGMTIVIMHVTLAYLRPLNKLELTAQVEEILHKDLIERTHPELPRVRQMARWAVDDPTWPETVQLPVVRPPAPKRP